jgi:hypothetical protein
LPSRSVSAGIRERKSTRRFEKVMPDADELFSEAANCRRLAGEADALTRCILLELADQYEDEAHLLLAYPPRSTNAGTW